MTESEAIVNEKSRAENCKGHYDRFVQMESEEHERIADWLEELKAYRQYIDLTKIPEQYKLGFQDGIIAGNNKAIDDFYNKIIEAYEEMKNIPQVEKSTVHTIALGIMEQLKNKNLAR